MDYDTNYDEEYNYGYEDGFERGHEVGSDNAREQIEDRVREYISNRTNGQIGGGENPVEFILASYDEMREGFRRKTLDYDLLKDDYKELLLEVRRLRVLSSAWQEQYDSLNAAREVS